MPIRAESLVTDLESAIPLPELPVGVEQWRVPEGAMAFAQLILKTLAGRSGEGILVGMVGPRAPTLLVIGGVRAPGRLFLGPDNGLLSPFVREGRAFLVEGGLGDALARLDAGEPPDGLGLEHPAPVKLSLPRITHEGDAVVGEVVCAVGASLVTNLTAGDLPAPLERLRVSFYGRAISAGAATIGRHGLVEVPLTEPLHSPLGMPVVVEPR